MRRRVTFTLLSLVFVVPALAQSASVQRLVERGDVKAALAAARRDEEAVLADEVRLTEIPAPLGKEQQRGAAMRASFEALGLKNVRIDGAGNVIGDRPGRRGRPRVVLAAHLDTVFPEGTNVKVSRQGETFSAPGIADNGRGLAVLLGVIRALAAGKVQTEGSLTFVANVGEEGLGDLRGMRELFDRTLKGEVDAFVSIDGSGLDVVNEGVGSFRYRVTFRGPGGHSFGDFGMANPVHALGRAIALVADFDVPSTPRTTFNVGRVGGGTSVNSIAHDAWMEVDMRSGDTKALAALDKRFRQAMDKAVADESARWNDRGKLSVTVELVGNRPAARISDQAPIVRVAMESTRAVGGSADLGSGSTDANYPMSLGIPAIAIGGGGSARGAHSLAESFDAANSAQGTERAVVLVVALTEK